MDNAKKIDQQKKDISIYLISLLSILFLMSCRGVFKSQPKGALKSKKAIYKQAIHKSYLWLDRHPASMDNEGVLAILEETIAFYILRNNTDDALEKQTYLNELQKRTDLIALKDYKVQPKEHTLFLAVTMIIEKLGIDSTYFRKQIKEELLSSPLLYTQHITNTIWNIIYLKRLGYEPQVDIETAMSQSILKQESDKRFLFQLASNQVNPLYINPMTITAYFLTHEIFSLTDFGALPPPPVIEDNRVFFSELLDKTIQWSITIEHVDLLAELIMCVKMLDLKDVPSVQRGIEFILSKQEDNGTFGPTNPTLPNIYRHGILVSMMALSMV